MSDEKRKEVEVSKRKNDDTQRANEEMNDRFNDDQGRNPDKAPELNIGGFRGSAD